MVCFRRAARLRRCEGTRKSPAAASGEAPGPGRREDSESGPGRLHSAELMAARLVRRPQTAQSQPRAEAQAGARTERVGGSPTDSPARREAARDHRPARV
ncbi:unnamed protein product [Coccothraustes coccothraustes]